MDQEPSRGLRTLSLSQGTGPEGTRQWHSDWHQGQNRDQAEWWEESEEQEQDRGRS